MFFYRQGTMGCGTSMLPFPGCTGTSVTLEETLTTSPSSDNLPVELVSASRYGASSIILVLLNLCLSDPSSTGEILMFPLHRWCLPTTRGCSKEPSARVVFQSVPGPSTGTLVLWLRRYAVFSCHVLTTLCFCKNLCSYRSHKSEHTRNVSFFQL